MEQIASGFGNVRLLPSLSQGAKPLNRPVRWHSHLSGLLHLRERGSQVLHSLQVRLVTDPATDVIKSQFAHLALDPGTVDGDGTDCRAEGGNHSGDDPVVKLDASSSVCHFSVAGQGREEARSSRVRRPAVKTKLSGITEAVVVRAVQEPWSQVFFGTSAPGGVCIGLAWRRIADDCLDAFVACRALHDDCRRSSVQRRVRWIF
jgi:hypothetical protein